MAVEDRTKRRTASIIVEAERLFTDQVPQNRREEILEYLKLFGYKPERTILQVHIPGFFNKRR